MIHQETQLNILQDILNRQAEVYAQVEERMAEKRKILVEGTPHRLATLDQELTALIQKATILERERMDWLTEMGYEDQTLRQVIASLNPIWAKPLNDLRDRLLRQMANIQETNRESRSLLDLSIKWIEDTVEVIAQAIAPEAGAYDHKGAKNVTSHNQDVRSPMSSTIERQA
jgi:hypothetical protein